jgi:hypothetical protein
VPSKFDLIIHGDDDFEIGNDNAGGLGLDGPRLVENKRKDLLWMIVPPSGNFSWRLATAIFSMERNDFDEDEIFGFDPDGGHCGQARYVGLH